MPNLHLRKENTTGGCFVALPAAETAEFGSPDKNAIGSSWKPGSPSKAWVARLLLQKKKQRMRCNTLFSNWEVARGGFTGGIVVRYPPQYFRVVR